MANSVRFTFDTSRWDLAMRLLLKASPDIVEDTLTDVADNDLLPAVREATPQGKTGNLRAGWKRGAFNRAKRTLNVINTVFYSVWIEFGTLEARKKKLSSRTLKRRGQKRARAARGKGRFLEGGGIEPHGMLRKAFRVVRARKAIQKAAVRHVGRTFAWVARRAEARG